MGSQSYQEAEDGMTFDSLDTRVLVSRSCRSIHIMLSWWLMASEDSFFFLNLC